MSPGKLKVDMDKEYILVPINGHIVPFHVSMIKNMTQPDPDLRINFYIPGSALGKEVRMYVCMYVSLFVLCININSTIDMVVGL